MKLDPHCIVKYGFLTKSPPLEKIKSKVARWHLRWFVLYDTKPRADIDPAVEREVELYYYTNEDSQKLGEIPLGRIDLIGCEVRQHPGRLHDYPYVIDIITPNRTYYLCATQKPVHRDWLRKIYQHSIPPLVNSKQIEAYQPYSSWDGLSATERQLKYQQAFENRQPSVESPEQKHATTAPTSPINKAAFWGATQFFEPTTLQHNRFSTSSMLNTASSDEDVFAYSQSAWDFKSALNHSKQLQLKPTLSIVPLNPALDSDTDEGIVRTSSESSSTSTNAQTTNVTKTFFRSSQFDNWERGMFSGPKLSPTKKAPLLHQKSSSLVDIPSTLKNNNNDLFVPLTRQEASMTMQRLAKGRRNPRERRTSPTEFISFEAHV